MVNQSGEVLVQIVASVKRVTDIVGEIAAASREQSTGVDQVAKAMAQMDQVTQQNAGQTEELSSTAQGLSSSAEQLQALVARFQLENQRRARYAGAQQKPTAKAAPKKSASGAKQFSQTLHSLSHHVAPASSQPVLHSGPAELEMATAEPQPNGGFAKF